MFDHRVANVYSAIIFLVAWAHLATSSTVPTTMPSFRRSLLNPRLSFSYDSSPDHIYVPYSSLPAPPSTTTGLAMISRIYLLPEGQLSALQSLTTNKKTPSKLVTLSAFLWNLIAQHAFEFHNDAVWAEDATCKLEVVVGGRQLLDSTMGSYFRNVLSIPFARVGVKELTELPLADVAKVVGRFLN